MRLRIVLGAALAGAAVAAAPASASVRLAPLGSFDAPVFVAAPTGQDDDVYVVERGGAIRLVRDGKPLARPFLTIPDVDTTGEGGLLSLAFSPDYATSGRFYVYLTPDDANPGAAPHAPIQIREYRRAGRSAAGRDVAAADSGRPVLTIAHPDNTNHYGGTLAFGPDNLLYAGTGDGGGSGDPGGHAQDRGSMLGKLLRLDPRATAGASYGVPAGNPFAADAGAALVWSYGLRNPFRFAFDRSGGDLTIADVGQDRFEEIDLVRAPAAGRATNFGWNACEGSATYPSGGVGTCALSGATGPVFAYAHDGERCSITGGVVVRDRGLEELAGRYLYGDFCGDEIRSQVLGSPATDAAVGGLTVEALAGVGEDACGRVYLASLNGPVGRLTDGSDARCKPVPAVPRLPRPPLAPVQGETVTEGIVFRLRVAAARRQRVLRRRSVAVRVRCSKPCSMRTVGRLRAGRSVAMKSVKRRRLTARATLRVPIGRHGRARIRRALHRRRAVRIALTVRARDSAGKLRTARVRIRVTG